MIDLAPHHKIGLPLSSPVLIGAGFGGYGDAYEKLIDLSSFGALVTNPITLRPQQGTPPPRLLETEHGFILNTGHHNPGVKKVLRQYGKSWTRLKRPIIAHLPAAEPDSLERTARALSSHPAIAAIEVGIPPDAYPADVTAWLSAIQAGCELPILAKLPLAAPPDIIEAAADACANALVLGTPPVGSMPLAGAATILTGELWGPHLYYLTLHQTLEVRRTVDLPLIAASGIHTLAAAKYLLAHGATAIQLDSLLMIDPALAGQIAAALA